MSESTRLKQLRRKGYKINCLIRKGYKHYLNGQDNPVYYDVNGQRHTGYEIYDVAIGLVVYGVESNFDHTLETLDEVEECLKIECARRGEAW